MEDHVTPTTLGNTAFAPQDSMGTFVRTVNIFLNCCSLLLLLVQWLFFFFLKYFKILMNAPHLARLEAAKMAVPVLTGSTLTLAPAQEPDLQAIFVR